MPCDTIRTVKVDIGKMDPGLAAAALTALGWDGFARYSNAQLILKRDVANAEEQFKQAYSAEVVKSQAKKYGWQLKQTAPFKFEVVKK
jgi:hypothetical protein